MSESDNDGRNGIYDFRRSIMETTGCGDASPTVPPTAGSEAQLSLAEDLLQLINEWFVDSKDSPFGKTSIPFPIDKAKGLIQSLESGCGSTASPGRAAEVFRIVRNATEMAERLAKAIGTAGWHPGGEGGLNDAFSSFGRILDAAQADLAEIWNAARATGAVTADRAEPRRTALEYMSLPPAFLGLKGLNEEDRLEAAEIYQPNSYFGDPSNDGDCGILDMDPDGMPGIDYVFPNFPAGTVGSLISPGGTGKSTLALQLAASIASGSDMLRFWPYEAKGADGRMAPAGAVYINIEDQKEIVDRRLAAIGSLLDGPARLAAKRNLSVRHLQDTNIDFRDRKWAAFLLEQAAGKRLMAIDTFSRSHSFDENSAKDMGTAMKILEVIAKITGCSILFLHHTSKSAAMNGDVDKQQAARGSSVTTDNARFQSFISVFSENDASSSNLQMALLGDTGIPFTIPDPTDQRQRRMYVRFGVCKSNSGAPFEERCLKRGREGIFSPLPRQEIVQFAMPATPSANLQAGGAPRPGCQD
ncbi:MAG: helicase RepA family protein [Deltaproteobacteria bacterium]|jgi:hypothetical protein|nr:helicase RepA family protein [Deltaproteobacteria bacterium]